MYLILYMNQVEIRLKIAEESDAIKNISSPAEAVNRIYNLISMKASVNDKDGIYKLTKLFIIYYVQVIKDADYGYDDFNFFKIKNVLGHLNYKSQISILQFIISTMTKELPEYEKEWFVNFKNEIQIKEILEDFKFSRITKLISLYTGLNIWTLITALLIVYLLASLIFLPSPFDIFEIFEVKYEKYSSDFIVNHFLNILTLFADIDNDFKIIPLNWFATLLLVTGKVAFILMVVNFVYTKITNKMTS